MLAVPDHPALTPGDVAEALQAVDAIVAHPRFAQARGRYLDSFLGTYRDDPFLSRLLIESGRFFVHKLIVVLAAAEHEDRPETWLTMGRLKRELGQFGMASDRQVDHLVQRLISVGFLDQRRPDADRRVRLLRPTGKMRAHEADWLIAHFVPLTILWPEEDYSRIMNRDPQVQIQLGSLGLQFLPLAAQMIAQVPDMLLFFDFAAGHLVLAALLQNALATPGCRHAALPFASVGDRFGVSRTHVRKLLSAAERMGLVRLLTAGGQAVEILPRLWTSYDRSIANGMYLHAQVHRLITARTP